jgi:hypothetical protein
MRVPTYRLHAHDGDDLGLLEHPAPNLEPGDVVVLADGREALVMARVEARPGRLEALLEVLVAPSARAKFGSRPALGRPPRDRPSS